MHVVCTRFARNAKTSDRRSHSRTTTRNETKASRELLVFAGRKVSLDTRTRRHGRLDAFWRWWRGRARRRPTAAHTTPPIGRYERVASPPHSRTTNHIAPKRALHWNHWNQESFTENAWGGCSARRTSSLSRVEVRLARTCENIASARCNLKGVCYTLLFFFLSFRFVSIRQFAHISLIVHRFSINLLFDQPRNRPMVQGRFIT